MEVTEMINLSALMGVVLAMPTASVLASTDFTSISKSNRPAKNPDFDPDQSCLFDVLQDKCISGSEQECPEGF
jgi:hypothetical protein